MKSDYSIGSNMSQFIQHINMQGEAITDYTQLHQWSIEHSQRFWLEVWQFCDVIGYKGECVLGEKVPQGRSFDPILDSVWFPDAQINYAENLLSYAFQEPDSIAIYQNDENGNTKSITWQELSDKVSIIQQWLKQNNIGKNDVIASLLPSCIENIISLLAVTSIGAVWCPISPDEIDSLNTPLFLKNVQPKAMICSNGYYDDGKNIDLCKLNQHIANSVMSLTSICQIEHVISPTLPPEFNEKFSDWEAILASYLPRSVKYERVWFNSPLFVTKGTGSTPVTHSVGGTILNHLKEQQLQLGIQPNSICHCIYPPADPRWLWHVSLMANGSSLALFEGNPIFPSSDSFYKLLDTSDTTVTMIDEPFLLKLMSYNNQNPMYGSALSSLKTLLISAQCDQSDLIQQAKILFKSNLQTILTSPDLIVCGSMCFSTPYSGEAFVKYDALGLDIRLTESETQLFLTCHNNFPNQPKEYSELMSQQNINLQDLKEENGWLVAFRPGNA
ncbi:AMP-binding protein [Vibrio salinus]|uniref:AMP-binding protein n=1 Tax=Vibrio salinus TaxID=2899784 RepID=UPI001E606558|nr:AMP-binding protein [Vibrio salinus]MCE0494920.1 AMP-binding protein [Vibrio salinus]